MKHAVRAFLTSLGTLASHPSAFLVWAIYVAGWAVLDRGSLNGAGIATAATWLMTLFIQRAGHRDTQALHAKLDELLKAQGEARTEISTIDRMQPEEIEAHREAEAAQNHLPAPHGSRV